MSRRSAALGVTLVSALAVSACSSSRLSGASPQPIRSAAAAPMVTPVPVAPMETAPVDTGPLPPIESQPIAPIGGGPIDSTVTAPAPGPVAALPPPAASPAPSSRTAMVGGWTAQAAGGSCRIQLSSAPALDLYRASASGCSNQDLAKVNAWDYRDGEVYLYQTGGTVAARLRGSSGGLSGALTKSGAPLSLSR